MTASLFDRIVLWLVGSCAVGCVTELAIALGRTWVANRHGEEALQRAEMLTREDRIEDAVRVAGRLPGPVSTVLVAGLSAANEAEAERAMADAARAERRRLSAPVRVLDVLAGIALLLPLTALGLARYTGDDAAVPAELEGRLLVLVLGLATAILAVLGRFWVLARVRRIAVEMEKGAAVVYNTAR